MSVVPIIQFSVEPVSYLMNWFTTHIAEYKLHEMTNSYCGDIPSINDAHPLALEYGNALASDGSDYTSQLPAIGVEFLEDNQSGPTLLGMGGRRVVEITEAFIETLQDTAMSARFRGGNYVSDATLTALEAERVDRLPDKLYGYLSEYFQSQMVNVSIWTDHADVTKTIYTVVRSLLNRAKLDMSDSGVKNVSISGQGAIYNYEFGRTLFGAEFNVSFMNPLREITVDLDLTAIGSIEETLINNPSVKSTPVFVPKSQ